MSGDPRPAERPTMYFIGVTTGESLIMRVFPRWAELLELDCELAGIDLPLRAPREAYSAVVDRIASDPLSLGALVTTHKLDLYAACAGRFDEIDRFATVMSEISSISKHEGRMRGRAKDPISSALALDAFVPPGHWGQTRAGVFLAGAGGAATAIAWALATRPADDSPSSIVASDIDRERLRAFRDVLASVDTDVPVSVIECESATDNDEALLGLPPGSLVVNASGLGKDRPGSPFTNAVRFPASGLAWDLNYRGDLVFLSQARAAGDLMVEDGWTYFIHGWTQVIADVFDVQIPTDGPDFDRLVAAAVDERAGVGA